MCYYDHAVLMAFKLGRWSDNWAAEEFNSQANACSAKKSRPRIKPFYPVIVMLCGAVVFGAISLAV